MTGNISKKVIIFGTGTIGEIADYYLAKDSPYEVVAFTSDQQYIKEDTFLRRPLIPFDKIEESLPPREYSMFVALSYAKQNQVRSRKYYEAKEKKYNLISYVSSKTACWDNVKIGENCFILENETIQPFVEIGNNVTLWSGNHIGHHSHIHSHAFIASHVVISGHCTIGERTFIGVNSTLRDSCKIGSDCFIGMNASVQNDVSDGSVVMGPKSTVYAQDDRRSSIIKRKFFK